MKNLSLLFIVFLLLHFLSFAQENWIVQNSGTTESLRGVSFTDANTGTIVGSLGTILRTTDGGNTWFPQQSGTTEQLYGVSFPDANNGWVTGYEDPGGVIFRTTDGGSTWTEQLRGITVGVGKIFFTDLNYGTTIGAIELGEALIYRTTNGGTTWAEQSIDVPISLSGLYFTDAFNGTLVGHQGIILRTRNGGGTFASITITEIALAGSQILEVNSTVGFSIDDDIIINPGGVNEETNKIMGFGSLMLETPLMFDHQAGEIIVNLIPTSIEDNRNNTPREYALYHNFPNPFNPTTKIKYSIPQSSNVSIKVFDILGNEIETLVNEERPAGIYQIDFDASEYPSGIYFYRINAGDYTETKKMVLLK